MKKRDEILTRVITVPAMPPSAVEIVQNLQNPYFDVDKLTKSIEIDPGLTSNILRLVNSAYFGSPRKISSIKDAVIRLGARRILQLSVATAVTPMVKMAVRGYDLPAGGLWEHSVAVALAAEKLAGTLDVESTGEAFTSGLLHDLGKTVLSTFLDVDAADIVKTAIDGNIPFDKAEEKVMGISHAEVGAALLEVWNLPEALIDAVRWHHEPDKSEMDSKVCDLVHISNVLCIIGGIGLGIDSFNRHYSESSVKKLDLDADILENVLKETAAEINGLREIFLAETTA